VKDLTNVGWIKFKGVLFLVVGLLSFVLIVLGHPGIKDVLLLCVAIWCFCRFYYFAFYVIEHYVDPTVSLLRTLVVCAVPFLAKAEMNRTATTEITQTRRSPMKTEIKSAVALWSYVYR